MAQIFTAKGFQFVESNESGKGLRMVFDSDEGDLELRIGTGAMLKILPILSRSARAARLKADQSGGRYLYRLESAVVGVAGGSEIMLTIESEGVDFPFVLSAKKAQQLMVALRMKLDDLDGLD